MKRICAVFVCIALSALSITYLSLALPKKSYASDTVSGATGLLESQVASGAKITIKWGTEGKNEYTEFSLYGHRGNGGACVFPKTSGATDGQCGTNKANNNDPDIASRDDGKVKSYYTYAGDRINFDLVSKKVVDTTRYLGVYRCERSTSNATSNCANAASSLTKVGLIKDTAKKNAKTSQKFIVDLPNVSARTIYRYEVCQAVSGKVEKDMTCNGNYGVFNVVVYPKIVAPTLSAFPTNQQFTYGKTIKLCANLKSIASSVEYPALSHNFSWSQSAPAGLSYTTSSTNACVNSSDWSKIKAGTYTITSTYKFTSSRVNSNPVSQKLTFTVKPDAASVIKINPTGGTNTNACGSTCQTIKRPIDSSTVSINLNPTAQDSHGNNVTVPSLTCLVRKDNAQGVVLSDASCNGHTISFTKNSKVGVRYVEVHMGSYMATTKISVQGVPILHPATTYNAHIDTATTIDLGLDAFPAINSFTCATVIRGSQSISNINYSSVVNSSGKLSLSAVNISTDGDYHFNSCHASNSYGQSSDVSFTVRVTGTSDLVLAVTDTNNKALIGSGFTPHVIIKHLSDGHTDAATAQYSITSSNPNDYISGHTVTFAEPIGERTLTFTDTSGNNYREAVFKYEVLKEFFLTGDTGETDNNISIEKDKPVSISLIEPELMTVKHTSTCDKTIPGLSTDNGTIYGTATKAGIYENVTCSASIYYSDGTKITSYPKTFTIKVYDKPYITFKAKSTSANIAKGTDLDVVYCDYYSVCREENMRSIFESSVSGDKFNHIQGNFDNEPVHFAPASLGKRTIRVKVTGNRYNSEGISDLVELSESIVIDVYQDPTINKADISSQVSKQIHQPLKINNVSNRNVKVVCSSLPKGLYVNNNAIDGTVYQPGFYKASCSANSGLPAVQITFDIYAQKEATYRLDVQKKLYRTNVLDSNADTFYVKVYKTDRYGKVSLIPNYVESVPNDILSKQTNQLYGYFFFYTAGFKTLYVKYQDGNKSGTLVKSIFVYDYGYGDNSTMFNKQITAHVGDYYSYSLKTAKYAAPTLELACDNLPAGLTANKATMEITGTLAFADTYKFTCKRKTVFGWDIAFQGIFNVKENPNVVYSLEGAKVVSDVKAKSKYAKYIKWALTKKIIKACAKVVKGETKFCPTKKITRTQFIQSLYLALKSPAFNEPNKLAYKDVKRSNANYKAIAWGLSKGIFKVNKTKYNLKGKVVKKDIKLVNKLFGKAKSKITAEIKKFKPNMTMQQAAKVLYFVAYKK